MYRIALGRGLNDDSANLIKGVEFTVGLDIKSLLSEVYTATGDIDIVCLYDVDDLVEPDTISSHLVELQGNLDFFGGFSLYFHPFDILNAFDVFFEFFRFVL